PHDLRHLAITRLLEKGVDRDTVNAISGRISQRMREYYSYQRTQVRYKAAQAIEPEYDIRKLTADGRRRIKQERVKIGKHPQTKEPVLFEVARSTYDIRVEDKGTTYIPAGKNATDAEAKRLRRLSKASGRAAAEK